MPLAGLLQRHGGANRVESAIGDLAAEHPQAQRVARLGWLAKGVVYVIAGLLAMALLTNDGAPSRAEGEASPTGAVERLSESTLGPLLIWILIVGLLLYAAWRLVSALLPGPSGARHVAVRIGYVVSAVIYASLAMTALSMARNDSTSTDGNQQVSGFAATIVRNDVGRWLVFVAGIVVIAAALDKLRKGFTGDVNDELDLSRVSSARRRFVRGMARTGEAGRGIGIALVGVFLMLAGLHANAAEATGVDGALRRIVDNGIGAIVVAIVAIGFIVYGVFCVATFHLRRLQAP